MSTEAKEQTRRDHHLTPKGERTRERIVEVAADLVFRQGAARTTIAEVRELAEVSGSQMSHYFADKQALLRAVVAHQAESMISIHEQPELERLESLEALEAWAAAAIELQRERGCVGGCCFGSIAGQLAEAEAELRPDLAEGYDRLEGLFRRGLAVMRARGELREDADPDELAYVLLSAHQGGSLLTQTKREIFPLEAALKGALAYVRSWASLSPPDR